MAGTGAAGSVDGPVSTATFNYPVALALGSTANIYVAEGSGGNIRKISLATGEVSTLASGFPGVAGLAVTSTGTVYAAANQMQVILQISQSGVATVAGLAWEPGSADGSGSTARFNLPIGIALGSTGKLYIADLNNQKIRLVTLP